MTNREHTKLRSTSRHGLASGVAALALLLGAPALAQPQPPQSAQPAQGVQGQAGQAPSQQAGSNQPAVMGQMRTAEQSLRVAQQQLSSGQNANLPQARTAVTAGMTVIGRVPNDMQQGEEFRTAREQLTEANQALQGQQPDARQAANQLGEAADALAALARRMGNTADAGRSGQRTGQQAQAQGQEAQGQQAQGQQAQRQAGSGAQIAVQQPAPQVTVQQPAPQVTVQQPRPEVTVRQAQPEVRVQQAEPQVTVQRQGEPQVTVQRQGEPQVTVQREGQAQGDSRQQGQPQATQQRDQRAQPQADQRTGAATTPAPAQSAGSQPQQAAASPAAGVPLQSVQRLIGTNVYGSNGRESGEVRNLLVDGEGRVRAAVIEWGGFLGIGEKEALVPIERLRLGEGGNDRVTMTMTRDELEALPRYDRNNVTAYGRDRGWGDGVRMYR